MRKAKRGQVAVWVILAVVIVGVIVVLLLIRRPLSVGPGERVAFTPQQYLTSCLEPATRPLLEELGKQGGSREPVGFLVYNDTKVPYVC